MRLNSLQRRIAVVVLGVGLLALLVDGGLLGVMLTRSLTAGYGNDLALRAQALSGCCLARSPALLLLLTQRAATTGQGGTDSRFALVVDPGGHPEAAPRVPAASESILLDALRRHALKPAGQWTVVSGLIIAQAPIVRRGRTLGTLLLGTTLSEVYRLRGGLVFLILWSGLVALLVATLAGLIAARAVTRPIRSVTAAARAIASGQFDRRAPPGGKDETGELARAFNGMVEEVVRQRKVERDLLANVSHELAAPLGIIRGYAEALADGVLEGPAHQERALRAIAAESRRLSTLVGDLLDLALLESGQATLTVELVRPNDLLADVRDRVAPAAEEAGVALHNRGAGELPPLHTDGARLEGVLVNLITNALAHTPRGGEIALSAEPDGSGIAMRVRDTGEGIDPADLPHIFERFYRADKSRDRRSHAAGVGLGLAICRQVVTALGGTIGASSVPGEGSVFTIWLPVGDLPPAPPHAAPVAGALTPSRSGAAR